MYINNFLKSKIFPNFEVLNPNYQFYYFGFLITQCLNSYYAVRHYIDNSFIIIGFFNDFMNVKLHEN